MIKKKVGRPKKDSSSIPENPNSIIIVKKRGRGRPRKYPIKELIRNPLLGFENQRPILNLIDLIRHQEGALLWDNGSKRRRTKRRRKRRKENWEELSFPSSKESSFRSTEELCFPSVEEEGESNSNESESKPDSWSPEFVIPGPIPDLDALIADQSLFRKPDYFSDLPEDWDLIV
ncbi:AT hook, DNA-binding motif [Parasponia andersonii]|uniref:AT hook, DNA-binding motif n=1 Tax=Parasponia andersonii TaxID=3476 RepID=A0A2P5A691_PARAD|nr:AT hook, DNA-binding motif [Parasponia andersonii]